jgi:uncharacterized protein YjbI with pentapeptide repeats
VQFLYESGLISKPRAIVNLAGADLSEADLNGHELYRTDLREANLRQAELRRADLTEADLSSADLTEANLRVGGSSLTDSSLTGTHMDDLRETIMRGAVLRETDLTRRKDRDSTKSLRDHLFETIYRGEGANLRGTDLSEAKLTFALVTQEQLERTASLKGATMPNGQKYEDWLRSKDSGEVGENDGSP